MKINEFFKSETDNQLPFNPSEDLVVFMRNDPMFYRKHYFPTMAKMSDMQERGENIDPIVIMSPFVDKGIQQYCQKFNIKQQPEKVFPKEERSSIIKKIYSEEQSQIKNGSYRMKK